MWNRGREDGRHHGAVAVAIDKDKGSQYALKWTTEHLANRGDTVILIYVNTKCQSISNPPYVHAWIAVGNQVSISDVNDTVASAIRQDMNSQTKEMFLPFRCFCTRKDIQCKDVVLEDTDISRALIDYISHNAIENIVVGASARNAFVRFKATDVPTSVSKGAPDFCTVYVVSKGKISSVRTATRPAPAMSPLRTQIHNQPSKKTEQPETPSFKMSIPQSHPARAAAAAAAPPPAQIHYDLPTAHEEVDAIRSPFTRGTRGASTAQSYGELSLPDTDVSFGSSGRPSSERMYPSSLYDHVESTRPARISNADYGMDNRSFESIHGQRGIDLVDHHSTYSHESDKTSWSSQSMDELEVEMRRLRMELKQTMDLYSSACKEAISAKQKARELHRWKIEEEQRLEEARMAEEAALAIAEKEKAKCKVAMEAAEAAQRIAELEAQKRINAEMKALKESEEKKKALDALVNYEGRYRRYSIEVIEQATEFFAESRKIGEGGYGPVYKCFLDHTPVAIKVLRPDAAQGRAQFQQEVEVLSSIRHPNMVLLLGACPEYGCLVYEYMANGSLEDRLFRRGNSPVLSWQVRFRIAAEIGTSLLFLHQSKPEPLVHRDLKPGNILLDRNYVSKISDVGLARLVPPNVANNVTQYRMTSTAGTFCYIDPEYQQTGMLGVKSDVYSLGILLLQLITAKQPMGLTHHMEKAIEKGIFEEMLDPLVPDWPVEDSLSLARMALKCSELRRKDRPDLGKTVVPELNRLRSLADEYVPVHSACGGPSPNHSLVAIHQEIMSESLHSGYESRSSASSLTGKRTSMA
ncbi:U-box domain-containing protein 52-like [Aristolochia californica]|uniref:U-box domain-containing protein 52-like n=1 Tax=Aristolochia californica TaxID=171875 RepID=UPI0035E076E7